MIKFIFLLYENKNTSTRQGSLHYATLDGAYFCCFMKKKKKKCHFFRVSALFLPLDDEYTGCCLVIEITMAVKRSAGLTGANMVRVGKREA